MVSVYLSHMRFLYSDHLTFIGLGKVKQVIHSNLSSTKVVVDDPDCLTIVEVIVVPVKMK